MCIHPGASPTFGGWRTMEAETWHLPEYRCLAPSLQPLTEPHWLRSPRCRFEQRFLYGNGPAQVGLGSFEPHRLYIKTERSVPATHANVELERPTSNKHPIPNIQRLLFSAFDSAQSHVPPLLSDNGIQRTDFRFYFYSINLINSVN